MPKIEVRLPGVVSIDAEAEPPTPAAGSVITWLDSGDGCYKLKRSSGEVIELDSTTGGSVPTGTGFRHVSSGTEDAAAALVQNADVGASAAIAESKLALGFATHSAANDPSSGEKAALPGTSGTPGSGNKYVTDADARNTNARTPTAHATTHQPGGSDAMAVDAAAATGSLRTIGTGAQQACAGNDSRLSNARTPTAHASTHQPGGSDTMAVDAAAATGSLRTIGSGALQACAGNDARLSDARTPTAHTHAESEVTGLVADLAAKVPTTRTLTATAPLTGGGDLSANRTLAISDFVASGASHARGAVPDPGASSGTTKFLREDATWATPPGGGGGGNFGSKAIVLDGQLIYSATVTGQAWVSSGSIIVCSVFADPVSGTTVEMLAAAGIIVSVATRVAGVGFDVWVYNPNGFSGTVTVHFTGN